MDDALKKAREILAEVTPLRTDCGKVCGARCCRSLEGELACRMFPLLPVIRDGTVKVAMDERARAVCPLLRQGLRGMDPGFKDAVREAGKLLVEDEEQREFLETLTAEQDELKALRMKLGGI